MPLSMLQTSSGDLHADLIQVLDALAEGLCGIDSESRVTFCNQAFLRLTRYEAPEVLGKTLHQLLHTARRDGMPYPEEECPIRKTIQQRQPVYLAEEFLSRKDGSVFIAECWAYPLRRRAGATSHVVTIQDVTQRTNMTNALRASEERFRQISDNIDQLFFLANLKSGVIVYLSPAFERIYGITRESAYRDPAIWMGLVPPEHREKVLAQHESLLKMGQEIGTEYPIQHPNGSIRWIKEHAKPIRNARGEIELMAGVTEDITEARQARDAVRLSEERFRHLVSNIPDVIWTADEKGLVSYVSPNVERIFGFTPAEVCAAKGLWLSRIHPEDMPHAAEAFRALFAKQQPFSVEYRVQRKDGQWVWVQARAISTRIHEGRLCADGLISDISERKAAEEELRSKTALLEAQTNSTLDGILVVDEHGHRLLQNQQLADLLKIPESICPGKDDQPLLDHVASRVKNSKQFLTEVEYLYTHPSESSRDEVEFIDGTTLDRYSAPVLDRAGKYYGRIWIFRDITERKQNEDRLYQLLLAVEQSPVSIVITDPEGTITYVNQRFTQCTGYSYMEVIGKNPRILKSGDSSPEFYKNLWSTISAGREWRGDFLNRKKNGDTYWESAAITPITNARGEITHFLAVKEDISERRAIETQLRQAQKLEAIGQLAAGIAHEINTPTQFVTDNLTFLRDSCQSLYQLVDVYRSAFQEPSQAALAPTLLESIKQAEQAADLDFLKSEMPRAIEQALDGARRVAKIVRAMKEFSHPDTGEKACADLNRAIETTVTVARNEWKYVADVGLHLDASLLPVPCFLGDVNQVILNLVVNAAHAIKDSVKEGQKGRITVATRKLADFAEISIADTGTGIPENIRSRIFEPFFTTKEVGKGTGQGLALAHSIVVKKHGGKIWFETEIGHGTTFFIHLPLQLSPAEAES